MHVGLKNVFFVPHNLVLGQGSSAPLLKFQMVPRLRLLMSSGSKNKETRYACLREAKALHSHRMWAAASLSFSRLHKDYRSAPLKEDIFSGYCVQ
jgi:hypothetical protein